MLSMGIHVMDLHPHLGVETPTARRTLLLLRKI
jgi:hypothetical protein